MSRALPFDQWDEMFSARREAYLNLPKRTRDAAHQFERQMRDLIPILDAATSHAASYTPAPNLDRPQVQVSRTAGVRLVHDEQLDIFLKKMVADTFVECARLIANAADRGAVLLRGRAERTCDGLCAAGRMGAARGRPDRTWCACGARLVRPA